MAENFQDLIEKRAQDLFAGQTFNQTVPNLFYQPYFTQQAQTGRGLAQQFADVTAPELFGAGAGFLQQLATPSAGAGGAAAGYGQTLGQLPGLTQFAQGRAGIGQYGNLGPMAIDPRGSINRLMSGQVSPGLGAITAEQIGRATRGFGDIARTATEEYQRGIVPTLAQAQALPEMAARQFMEEVSPALRSRALSQGTFGTTKYGQGQQLAASRIGEELARQTGQIGTAATLGAGDISRRLGREAGRFGEAIGQGALATGARAYETAQDRALGATGLASQFGLGLQGLGLRGQELGLRGDIARESAQQGRAGLGAGLIGTLGSQALGFGGQDIARMQAGLGALPGLAQMGMMPADIYRQLGREETAMGMASSDAARNQWMLQQQAPWMPFQQATGIYSALQGPTQAPSPNPWGATIGGGLAGMGAGGQAFGPWGAAGGLFLGGLGGYLSAR